MKYFYADSLQDYFSCVEKAEKEILEQYEKADGTVYSKMKPPVLWYRGLSNAAYSLLPSLYRGETRTEPGVNRRYSRLHAAEEVRMQHYIAKNYHTFSQKPSSRLEWQEVMQHHGMDTRVMDWSESSAHSLIFALGEFFDMLDAGKDARQTSVPCIWVLDPGGLNKHIFKELSDDTALMQELLEILKLTAGEKNEIKKRMAELKAVFTRGSRKFGAADIRHLEYIVNLSSINDDYARNLPMIKNLLLYGEGISLIYYLLLRIYSEGHILDNRVLPPLSIVNPYHTDRIRVQKGVFSVFPFYKEQPNDKALRNLGISPDAMENNEIARNYLYKIVLMRPQRIAAQALSNGMDGAWLYPEPAAIVKSIKNHKIK